MALNSLLRRTLALWSGLHFAPASSLPAGTAPPRAGCRRFDRAINALNRLPRPLLALATPALFAYAMADPAGFSTRMRALALVPEPLWWLLGAVVTFYFGAREAHYRRERGPETLPPPAPAEAPMRAAPDPSLF